MSSGEYCRGLPCSPSPLNDQSIHPSSALRMPHWSRHPGFWAPMDSPRATIGGPGEYLGRITLAAGTAPVGFPVLGRRLHQLTARHARICDSIALISLQKSRTEAISPTKTLRMRGRCTKDDTRGRLRTSPLSEIRRKNRDGNDDRTNSKKHCNRGASQRRKIAFGTHGGSVRPSSITDAL